MKADQGIRHQVIGNCGLTPFPLKRKTSPRYREFLKSVLGSYPDVREEFESAFEFRRTAPKSVTMLAGYNSMRMDLFGPLDRPLDSDERILMQAEISRALEEGARGISIGLAYQPALHADFDELVSLAKATPLLTVHMRNESARLIESIDEMIRVVREAPNCHLHISHLKIAGQENWGLFERMFSMVALAHEELGVTFDHYPFPFGSTGLAAIFPPEVSGLSREELKRVDLRAVEKRLEDREWENYIAFAGAENLILAGLAQDELNGKSVADVSLETIRNLILEEKSPAMLIKGQSDAVIDELLRLPYGCIGSDALPQVPQHPRLTRTFPEYLARMKRLGMSLEFAVEKASHLPRRIFGIEDGSTVEVEY